jgi:hypothetical protein
MCALMIDMDIGVFICGLFCKWLLLFNLFWLISFIRGCLHCVYIPVYLFPVPIWRGGLLSKPARSVSAGACWPSMAWHGTPCLYNWGPCMFRCPLASNQCSAHAKHDLVSRSGGVSQCHRLAKRFMPRKRQLISYLYLNRSLLPQQNHPTATSS